MAPFEKNSVSSANSGWSLTLGLLCVLFGVWAASTPLFTTVAVEFFLAWSLVFSAVALMVHAYQSQGKKAFYKGLEATLTFFMGILLLRYPFAAGITLTLMLGVLFLAQGTVKVAASFAVRPKRLWIWLLSAGILDGLFGGILLARWPSSGLWVIGLLVGINLMLAGWSMIVLGLSGQRELAHA